MPTARNGSGKHQRSTLMYCSRCHASQRVVIQHRGMPVLTRGGWLGVAPLVRSGPSSSRRSQPALAGGIVMKRIAGSLLLLAGLSGCVSPYGNPAQGEKKTADAKSSITVPASNGFNANPNIPMSTAWSPHPTAGHEPMAAKMDASGGTVASAPAPAPIPVSVSASASVPQPAPAILQASAVLPPSLVPMVTTPPNASNPPPAMFPASVPVAAMPQAQNAKDQAITTVSASQPGVPLTTTAKLDPTTPPHELELTPAPGK